LKKILFYIIFLISFSNLYAQTDSLSAGSSKGKKILVSGIILSISAIYDLETTYYGVNKFPSKLEEGNIFTKSMLNKGRPINYLYKGALTTFILWYQRKYFMSSEKYWWLPTLVFSGMQFAVGTYNISLILKLN
jgi:hypothetical protein